MIDTIKNLTESKGFQNFIVFVILLNAVIIGMETYPGLAQRWGGVLGFLDALCLSIFVIEIALKIIACGKRPQDFFKSGWNVFDFVIVAAAFLPGLDSQSTVLRLIRLLRVLRLLSALPSLQMMIWALVHSIPRIGQMALLSSLLFYVYAVIGQTLFGEHDPEHWATLHIALLSLFRTLTLEDWTDLMYTGMELYPWAWVYFVSFVLLATFVIFNMLIGIILNTMEEAREQIAREHAKQHPEEDLSLKIKRVRDALDELEIELKNREEKEK